jgi:hypothetical protein
MPAGQHSTNISQHIESNITKITHCYPQAQVILATNFLLKVIKVSFLFPSCHFHPGVSLRCHLNIRIKLVLAPRRGRQSTKLWTLMGKMSQPRNHRLMLKHPLHHSSLLDILDVLAQEQEVESVNSRSLEHF